MNHSFLRKETVPDDNILSKTYKTGTFQTSSKDEAHESRTKVKHTSAIFYLEDTPQISYPIKKTVYDISFPADISSLKKAYKSPVVFLLNGFNVDSAWYSGVVQQLAQSLIVATADNRRPYPGIPGLPRPGCESNYTYISGAHLNLLISSPYKPPHDGDKELNGVLNFRKTAKETGVILLTHSNGGFLAAAYLNGTCDGPNSPLYCDGYRPMKNAVLKASVFYEGYANANGAVVPIYLKPGVSAVYIAGSYNQNTEIAYDLTMADCKAFIRLSNANHYGVIDFVPLVNRSQVPPCALPAHSDPTTFTSTEALQKQHNAMIADITLHTTLAYSKSNQFVGLPSFNDLQSQFTQLSSSCHVSRPHRLK